MSELADSLHRYLTDLDVARVDVLHTDRGASFRGGSVSTQASNITAAARERHLDDRYGFWEHVVAAGVIASADTRNGLYAGAVRTKPNTVTTRTMTVTEFTRALASRQWEHLSGRQLVSLASRVTTRDGLTGHLYLLDFGLPDHPHLVDAIATALDVLGIHGTVVATGRSFHLYGQRITDWNTYASFLARAALLAPLVDARWVMHQIMEGRASLRVSSNTDRDTQAPKLQASTTRQPTKVSDSARPIESSVHR